MDCRIGYLADADWSFSLGEPNRGAGLALRSVEMKSVEKAPGLKSRGELDRRKSLVCRFGAAARGDLALCSPPAPVFSRGGENGGLLPTEPAAEEAGDGLASGFAMRRPPRVWARLRSASMVSLLFKDPSD